MKSRRVVGVMAASAEDWPETNFTKIDRASSALLPLFMMTRVFAMAMSRLSPRRMVSLTSMEAEKY